jgi:LysR family glycine cleavage system transcriptional activator
MIRFDRRYLPLNALRAFEVTGKTLSFTAAADLLGVTQSAISRQISRLEDLLGLPLFDRQHRAISLTEAGRSLLQTISGSFDALERKLNDLVEQDKRERLRVSIATTFANRAMPVVIGEFLRRYPHLSLEVDSPPDVTDLDQTDYDIAIVFSKPKITSHVMDLIWKEELTLMCAPALMADGVPDDPTEFIARQTMLHVKTEAGPYYAWEYWAKSAGLAGLDTHRGLVLDTSGLAVRFAMDGEGMVVCDRLLFRPEIEAGAVCTPFPQVCESGFGYYMMFRKEDLTNESVQLFRQFVIDRFANNPIRDAT